MRKSNTQYLPLQYTSGDRPSTIKNQNSSIFKNSTVKRIGLAALSLLTLCLMPTSVKSSDTFFFHRPEQSPMEFDEETSLHEELFDPTKPNLLYLTTGFNSNSYFEDMISKDPNMVKFHEAIEQIDPTVLDFF